MPQAIVSEVSSGGRIVGPVTLRAICGISAARDYVARSGIVIVIRVVVIVVRIIVTPVSVPEAHADTKSWAEAAVAECLCEGRTLAQVARLRGVSVNTIKSQVRHIFRKLEVDSRVALVRRLSP